MGKPDANNLYRCGNSECFHSWREDEELDLFKPELLRGIVEISPAVKAFVDSVLAGDAECPRNWHWLEREKPNPRLDNERRIW